jgi:hypothetical protein
MVQIGVENRDAVGYFSGFCDLEAQREEKTAKITETAV